MDISFGVKTELLNGHLVGILITNQEAPVILQWLSCPEKDL